MPNSSSTSGDGTKAYTYTSLNDGQTYWIRVVVTDNAGGIGKSAGDSEAGPSINTPSANTNPYNLTTSAPTNLRSTTSLTITASATDNEQTTLYYDLYWNGSSTVTETKSGTKGTTVTFTARTGLTKRTSYSWRIVVRDGVGGMQNGTSTSAYTNCPGIRNSIKCTKCRRSTDYYVIRAKVQCIYRDNRKATLTHLNAQYVVMRQSGNGNGRYVYLCSTDQSHTVVSPFVSSCSLCGGAYNVGKYGNSSFPVSATSCNECKGNGVKLDCTHGQYNEHLFNLLYKIDRNMINYEYKCI